MEKVIVWGTGEVAHEIFKQCQFLNQFEIIGAIDNNPQKHGLEFEGYKIYSPEVLDTDIGKTCDKIVILTDSFYEVREQIIKDYPEYKDCIENRFFFFRNSFIKKYIHSTDVEIQKIVKFVQNNRLELFNYEFSNDYKFEEIDVAYDEIKGLYYAMYFGKKMYFAKTINSLVKAKAYYRSILLDQDKNSPHQYCDDKVKVNYGDVVVDVGAAEGNFSLEYIDIISEVYIIETSPEWIYALECTFEDYRDKVHIINAYIGAFDENDKYRTLDSLINKKVNFIKMDIEGAEWDALRGATGIINNSEDLKLAICCYHSNFDQILIDNYMDNNGITHYTSSGYMCFPFTVRQGYVSTELRKGIVRGYKITDGK